ncbi:hypothetical protein NB689_002365 [Xanthomonas sacchari]|nr:hypothetical protein [Xanthomonas sacchari]
MAEFAQDQRQRLGAGAEHVVAHRADRGQRHQDIDQGAADHRTDDADRQVALGVLGFLGGGGDRIEAVEGEEDDRRRRHDPVRDAIGADRLGKAVRHERVQIGALERRQRHCHEDAQGDQLQHHQHRVERGALLGAGHQQAGHGEGDQHRRQVEDAAGMRPRGQRRRQVQVHAGLRTGPVQEADEVAGPAHRHRADHQRVLQDQAPAHHPGDRFAQRDVTVGVGAASGRHHRRHLRIGQRGAGADRPGHRERHQHRRPGQLCADADQGVDAGADDRADAERHQMRPAQRGHQPAAGLVDGDQVERLAPEQERHAGLGVRK